MATKAIDWLRDCEAEYQYVEKPQITMDEKTRQILRSNGYLN
jgi:hypothetical protein